eukprot:33203-Eustigmatos_ZCMA.PRE.1
MFPTLPLPDALPELCGSQGISSLVVGGRYRGVPPANPEAAGDRTVIVSVPNLVGCLRTLLCSEAGSEVVRVERVG